MYKNEPFLSPVFPKYTRQLTMVTIHGSYPFLRRVLSAARFNQFIASYSRNSSQCIGADVYAAINDCLRTMGQC
jgi:hypothetical protein